MSTFWTGKIIDAIGEATERATGTDHVNRAARAVFQAADSGSNRARLAAEFVKDGGLIRQATGHLREASTASRETVRAAVHLSARASFVKQIATICGKAGAAGAVVDGAVGGLQAAKHLQQGTIDGTQAVKHIGAEAGCGFVTSATGTAGTLAVFMVTGSMGPAALAAGMGASMGSRYLYRRVVPETLPNDEELREQVKKESARKAREAAERAEAEEDSSRKAPERPFTDDGGQKADEATGAAPDTPPGQTDRKDYGDGPDLEDIGPDPSDSADENGEDAQAAPDSDARSEDDSGADATDEDGDFFEDIGPAE